jgi:quaternary ammonium compound-resistance protein SugE
LTRATSAWLLLILAGLLEIGWPLGLKLSQASDRRVMGLVAAAVCMAASGALLWMAQREIPIGTAYAVWTGIGAAGTFLIGISFFGDPISFVRVASAGLIVVGVIGLKLSHV